jgi:hypothetical protein
MDDSIIGKSMFSYGLKLKKNIQKGEKEVFENLYLEDIKN